MKKCITMLILTIIVTGISLDAKEITVSTGANYANQVFYNLTTDEVISIPKDNWDIAFEIAGYDAGILLNSTKGTGLTLYYYPQSDEDSWDVKLDTTGMSSAWPKCYDSEYKWSIGAFNRGSDGFGGSGEYGWGYYSPGTHAIIGNSLYVIKLDDGSYKKIMIYEMFNSAYTFLVADLDGNNEKEYKVSKKDYITKNFAYFDLKSGQIIDREPNKGEWDLLFTKYTSILNMGGTITPYSVTGVKSNKEVLVAQVGEYLIDQAPVPNQEAYTDTITAIGHDWKKFILSENRYDINDMMIFFVAALDGLIYKIAFRDFGGSENGNFVFEKQELQTSVEENNGSISSFAIYPNVASTGQPVKLLLKNGNYNGTIGASIFSVNGVMLSESKFDYNGGLGVFSLQTNELAAGCYFITVRVGGISQVQKLIIE